MDVNSQANHHGSSAFSYLAPYVFGRHLHPPRSRSRTVRSPSRTGKWGVPASAPPTSTAWNFSAGSSSMSARGLHESPPLRLLPCQLCPFARHHPPADRARTPRRGPPPPRPPPPQAWPAVRPVVPQCASSCACGPPTATLSIPAEEETDWDRKRSVQHGLAPPTAPVRPSPAIRPHRTTDGGLTTDHGCQNAPNLPR